MTFIEIKDKNTEHDPALIMAKLLHKLERRAISGHPLSDLLVISHYFIQNISL